MGKSGHIARKIAATLASTGTPAFYVHPGEAGHGDLGMITDADVVLALSYSGESDEMLMLLPVLKRQGNTLIAMTGRPQFVAGARSRRAPRRQRAGRSLPARPGADLQHHRLAGDGRRARGRAARSARLHRRRLRPLASGRRARPPPAAAHRRRHACRRRRAARRRRRHAQRGAGRDEPQAPGHDRGRRRRRPPARPVHRRRPAPHARRRRRRPAQHAASSR